ncbi:hypothetical protein HDE_00993 [Halotydeus destructor]|nr:hypothetical protein HDE_00993 [Halotydeus destructor]
MATKVSSRFESFNLKDIKCKIAIFKAESILQVDTELKSHNLLHKINRYATTHLNCSEIVTTDVRSGDAGIDGNYSGVIGLIQRGEVDYTSAWMREDCIASDSIGVLAPVAGADVRIVSPVLNDSANTEGIVKYDSGSDKFEPFLDTFSLIDGYTYIGIFASIFTVAIIIWFDTSRRSSHPQTFKSLAKQLVVSLWCVFALMVSQGKSMFNTSSLKLMWFMMTIGIFIISSGYLLNLLGTEQVAKRSPDQIETLTDIISQKFEHIEPTLVTNAFTYALDKLVKPGSNEEKVFKKLRRHDFNFISVDAEKNKGKQTILVLVLDSM